MRGRLFAGAVSAALMIAALSVPAAARGPQSEKASELVDKVGRARIARHAATGQVRFVSGTEARPVATSAELGRPTTPRAAALRFMERYGSAFGIRDAAHDLRVSRTTPDGMGRTFVRYQQIHDGVPVLGGDLTVQVGRQLDVISANGEASPGLRVGVEPKVGARDAMRTAVAAVAKDYGVKARQLSASRPTLWVYDPALMGGRALPFARLVWRMEVTDRSVHLRQFILVDAERNVVALSFDQISHAKNREVCDANNTSTKVPCTSPFARTEVSGASAIAEVNFAFDYSGQTYDFFFNRFGLDSLDGAGMKLVSTTRYCDPFSPCPYVNAFWNGSQMVYGDGFAAADDVVGHELTHGVTEFSSNLFYYYQSGAINEALSDIFGELLDLTNSAGTDTAGSRWLVGEDIPVIGALRDMEDPGAFGHPDRMQSANYQQDFAEGDGGGVHSNSGVANKAAFLMVDGQTFNGRTVSPIGIDKTAAIWYRVNSQLLGTASDYADLGLALKQACADLVGQNVKNSAGTVTGTIAAADCTEVNDAVVATEMNLQPTTPGTAATHAPVCTSGTPSNVVFDQIAEFAPGWTPTGTANRWFYDSVYATSDPWHLWGDNPTASGDGQIRRAATVIPANAFLHFTHAYGFEDGSQYAQPDANNYDGGVLEYSTSGTGGPWIDAASLFTHNGYNGTVTNAFGNALGNRQAFTSESHGYISSRLNLNSLSGQSVNFRFRIGTDGSVGDYGWFIDDFRIYTCTAAVTRKPDGRIRIGTSGSFIGNNIYNTTGTSQSVTRSAARGATITFNISVQNDGTAADSFTLLGAGSASHYTVRYFNGAVEVTSAVVAGTYTTPSLAVGGTHLVTVKVKVKSTAPVGSKVGRLVTISSLADNTKKDAVKFTGKRN